MEARKGGLSDRRGACACGHTPTRAVVHVVCAHTNKGRGACVYVWVKCGLGVFVRACVCIYVCVCVCVRARVDTCALILAVAVGMGVGVDGHGGWCTRRRTTLKHSAASRWGSQNGEDAVGDFIILYIYIYSVRNPNIFIGLQNNSLAKRFFGTQFFQKQFK